jgi:hypothetical protein
MEFPMGIHRIFLKPALVALSKKYANEYGQQSNSQDELEGHDTRRFLHF